MGMKTRRINREVREEKISPACTGAWTLLDKTGVGREVWVIDRKSQPKLQRLVERRVTECLEVAIIVAGDCEGPQ